MICAIILYNIIETCYGLSRGSHHQEKLHNCKIVYVCFLLGDSPASEFYMPTFRNTVPFSVAGRYEDGTDRVFRNVDT